MDEATATAVADVDNMMVELLQDVLQMTTAANTTENQIVEYNPTAATATNASQSTTSDRGGQNGSRFGPRRQGDSYPQRLQTIPRRWGGVIVQQLCQFRLSVRHLPHEYQR